MVLTKNQRKEEAKLRQTVVGLWPPAPDTLASREQKSTQDHWLWLWIPGDKESKAMTLPQAARSSGKEVVLTGAFGAHLQSRGLREAFKTGLDLGRQAGGSNAPGSAAGSIGGAGVQQGC